MVASIIIHKDELGAYRASLEKHFFGEYQVSHNWYEPYIPNEDMIQCYVHYEKPAALFHFGITFAAYAVRIPITFGGYNVLPTTLPTR